jgi:hypothetical protein
MIRAPVAEDLPRDRAAARDAIRLCRAERRSVPAGAIAS